MPSGRCRGEDLVERRAAHARQRSRCGERPHLWVRPGHPGEAIVAAGTVLRFAAADPDTQRPAGLDQQLLGLGGGALGQPGQLPGDPTDRGLGFVAGLRGAQPQLLRLLPPGVVPAMHRWH
jgi:hypothetical protein